METGVNQVANNNMSYYDLIDLLHCDNHKTTGKPQDGLDRLGECPNMGCYHKTTQCCFMVRWKNGD